MKEVNFGQIRYLLQPLSQKILNMGSDLVCIDVNLIITFFWKLFFYLALMEIVKLY